ncbi:MAG: class I SAM-dependent methyltransferase [Anaeromyxobacteraceae bacterium]
MANEKQLALWNGPGAAGLLAVRPSLEAAIEPLGLATIDALRPAAGERALDVGCGLGETTLELARRVGPRGAAVGVDVAQPFLAVAREESRGVWNVSYLLADAQTHPFAAGFDLCFSRLGLMFFDDPPAAFGNLRRALRPGGRFAAVVWGPPAACAWVELPLRAVRGVLPSVPDPATSGPGPFSLSDRAALLGLLSDAGFADVRVEPAELPFRCGETPEQAAPFLLRFGPAAAALREAGPEGQRLRPRVEAALRDALVRWRGPRGVELPSSQLFATATAP